MMSTKPTYDELEKRVKELERELIEREHAEEALRESEERFRMLVEDAPFGISIMKPDWNFSYLNPKFTEIFGYTLDDIPDKQTWFEHAYPEEAYRDTVIAAWRNELIEEQSFGDVKQRIFSVRCKDGKDKIIHFRSVVLKDGWQFIAYEDITSQMKAEERYRTLVEESFDGIFIQKGSTIIFANHRLHEMLGYEPGELVGLEHWLVYHPEYQQLTRQRAQARLLGETVPSMYEVKLQRKDKSWLFGEINARATTVEGEAGIQVWVRDISERRRADEKLRRSEERYRSLFEGLPVGLFRSTPDGRFLDANSAFTRLLGCPDIETLLNMPATEFYRDPKERMQWKKLTEKEDGSHAYEVQWKKLDGTTIWVRESARTVKDAEGNVLYYEGAAEDITEQKRAEEALQASEEKYRTILETIEEGYYETDIKGNFIFLNSSLCEIIGYSRNELLSMNNRMILDEENARRVYKTFNNVYKTGTPFMALDHEIIRKDGEKRYAEVSVSLKRNPKGQPIGFHGIIRDLTEQKQAEKEIERRQKYLESVLHNAPDAIVTLDASHRIIDWNPGSEQVFGYTRDEVVGKDLDDIVARKDMLDEARSNTQKLLSGEKLLPRETVRYRKDGTQVNVIASGSPIIIDGELQGTVAMYTDISESKRAEEALRMSEERYRSLYESSIDGILYSDLKGNIIDANPSFLRMLDYSKEEITQMSIQDITPQKWQDAETELMRGELFSRGYSPDFEKEYIKKDGSVIPASIRAWFMRDKDGTPSGVWGIVRDITELRHAEEEKRTLEAQLQYAQKMEAIGTLAGGIAHNFNNLLMGIQGNASLLLLKTDPSHPNYTRLKSIEKAVENGSKLTSQLLGYAREGRYEIKPLDVNRLVRETAGTFAIAKREIRFHQDLAEELWGVMADQGQLEQVMLNLFVNAAEAMPKGGDLFVKTEKVTHRELTGKPYKAKPGNYVLISVRDSGMGMDQKTMERIFEPFFTTKGLSRGTGLGLASVYGIIKAHAGYIDVKSKKGEGTTFSIYLPASGNKLREEHEPSLEIVTGTETVLLADDEEMILDVGTQMLETLGYRVMVARGGKETVDVYEKNSDTIDLVILDMIMPDMGGGDTFDRLKEINPSVKVLLSSGYSIDGQAQEIMGRGCDGFIQKPFRMEELSQRIREIVKEKYL
jgi:two-component system cell cycle sensor histidine kinase/response regulator CckA